LTRLYRPVISAPTAKYLTKQTATISKTTDPKETAAKKWRSFRGAHRNEVAAKLNAMATGLSRCMYCEDSMRTHIDHFAPKATYPRLAFTWHNYFLACSHCNSNLKRSEFPLDASGVALLIDPVDDEPRDHIALSPSTGRYSARDVKGTESIKVFGLNRETCVDGRRNAWIAACELIRGFVRIANDGTAAKADAYLDVLRQAPFRAVLHELCILALESNVLVPADIAHEIRSRPELRA
jgi:uncharacterized protein (TIGR02646 family)